MFLLRRRNKTIGNKKHSREAPQKVMFSIGNMFIFVPGVFSVLSWDLFLILYCEPIANAKAGRPLAEGNGVCRPFLTF